MPFPPSPRADPLASSPAQNICGKTFLLGYSSAAEPLYYVTPSRRDTEPSETQFRHLVWVFEQACHLMGPGVDGVVVLLDCGSRARAFCCSAGCRRAHAD